MQTVQSGAQALVFFKVPQVMQSMLRTADLDRFPGIGGWGPACRWQGLYLLNSFHSAQHGGLGPTL